MRGSKFRHRFYKSKLFKSAADALDAWEHVDELKIVLDGHPALGNVIPDGDGLRKIRIGLPGRGKRSGGRVIYFQVVDEAILFVELYAKNEKEDLSADELDTAKKIRDEMLKQIRGLRP